MQKPKDGDVLNGVFYLNGTTWLILDQREPLREHLVKSLVSQREYISRLIKRADDLEKWLLGHPLEVCEEDTECQSKS